MHTQRLAIVLLLSAVLRAQFQSPGEYFGPLCSPADLGVSCHIDEQARTAVATITNRSEKGCHFVKRVYPDDRLNYVVIATSSSGKRLQQHKVSFGDGSDMTVAIAPKEKRLRLSRWSP